MHPLLDIFEQVCAKRAAHPAVADAALTLDYRGLHAVARGLAEQIGRATERLHIGILAPPSASCAAAIFACWYAGRVPVPLNFLLAPAEFAQVVRDADLDAVFAVDLLAGTARHAGLHPLVLSPAALRPGTVAAPDARPGDLAALIYTSGTAGTPKGVRLTFDNLVRNVRACVESAEIEPDHAFLSLLPQFHAFGFTTNTLVPLLIGATVHYLPRFSPAAVVSTIAERRIAVFITIASMFGALAAAKDATRAQLAALRLPVSGGEPLPSHVAEGFESRFGVPICEGYGMTEASPVVTLNTRRARRAGTVGRPLPGVEVIAADDAGRPRPEGAEGELLVRGHCVMQGYHNQPEATAAALRDGWLWTGDVGHVDADGFVSITGRAKDMMIVGGENVFPVEIERVLIEHPAVAEAAVVGAPDKLRGETPVAFVQLRDGAEAVAVAENELRAFCRERLAGYKVPRRVHVVKEMPRGPTGKVLKRALHMPEA